MKLLRTIAWAVIVLAIVGTGIYLVRIPDNEPLHTVDQQ